MKDQSAAALAGNNGFSLISNEKLIQLFALMVQCRLIQSRVEERLRELPEQGKGSDATLGLEATVVGVAIDALPEDTVVSLRRNLAVEFLRGASLDNCFQSLLAGEASPTPASQLKIATAAARVNVATGNGKIAVVFSGGGKPPLSLWQPALDQARASHLPIIFVRQNASLAELEGRGERGKASRKVKAGSVTSIAVDANDGVAVYRAATEAITHARKGNGPTIIECIGENARHPDPIAGMESYLTRKGLLSDEIKLEIADSFARQLDAAVAAVEATAH